MKLDLYGDVRSIRHPNQSDPDPHTEILNPHRAEVALVAPTEEQWKVILLDSEDTFDVIIHYPTGEREAVFSLVRD